jgi:hypothetical protein
MAILRTLQRVKKRDYPVHPVGDNVEPPRGVAGMSYRGTIVPTH